jgi:hypothetical protein
LNPEHTDNSSNNDFFIKISLSDGVYQALDPIAVNAQGMAKTRHFVLF